MPLIDLRLSLETDPQLPDPEVRAYIDLQPQFGLGSERELPLRRLARPEWIGTFAVGEAKPRYFLYRVALAAHAGASWDLTICERRSGATLLADSDTFEIAKCWLVGSCEGPKAREHGRVATGNDENQPGAAFDSARGASACRLLLARPGLRPARHLALQRFEPAQHREPEHD